MNLIFDLDGTLTDPEEGIVACIRYALEGLDRMESGEGDLTWCIGPPLRDSFAKLLDSDDPVLVEEAVTLYRERFAAKGLHENRVYDGIPDLLARLTEAGRAVPRHLEGAALRRRDPAPFPARQPFPRHLRCRDGRPVR